MLSLVSQSPFSNENSWGPSFSTKFLPFLNFRDLSPGIQKPLSPSAFRNSELAETTIFGMHMRFFRSEALIRVFLSFLPVEAHTFTGNRRCDLPCYKPGIHDPPFLRRHVLPPPRSNTLWRSFLCFPVTPPPWDCDGARFFPPTGDWRPDPFRVPSPAFGGKMQFWYYAVSPELRD